MSYGIFPATYRAFHARASLALAICAALTTPANVAAGAAGPATVEITKFAFAPREITVSPGTRIVWTNRDGAPHTVTSNDKRFASKGLDTEDTFEATFTSQGDFAYYCTLHPMMTGVVHVRKQ